MSRKLTSLIAIFIIFSLPSAAITEFSSNTTCGDNVCSQSETWKTCPDDCSTPEEVEEAMEKVNNASSYIDEDSANYETLQEAVSAYENGNYQRASRLADTALENELEAPGGVTGAFASASGTSIGATVFIIGLGLLIGIRRHRISAWKELLLGGRDE